MCPHWPLHTLPNVIMLLSPCLESHHYLVTTTTSAQPMTPDAHGYHMMAFVKPDFAMSHTIVIWMGINFPLAIKCSGLQPSTIKSQYVGCLHDSVD